MKYVSDHCHHEWSLSSIVLFINSLSINKEKIVWGSWSNSYWYYIHTLLTLNIFFLIKIDNDILLEWQDQNYFK